MNHVDYGSAFFPPADDNERVVSHAESREISELSLWYSFGSQGFVSVVADVVSRPDSPSKLEYLRFSKKYLNAGGVEETMGAVGAIMVMAGLDISRLTSAVVGSVSQVAEAVHSEVTLGESSELLNLMLRNPRRSSEVASVIGERGFIDASVIMELLDNLNDAAPAIKEGSL